MNAVLNKKLKGLNKTLFIGTLIFAFNSCSSREENESAGGSEMKGTYLTFNISGIEALNEVKDIENLANASVGKTNNAIGNLNEKLVSSGDLDALVSINMQSNNTYRNNATASSKSSSSIASTQPMPLGIQYRLLIYDETGDNLISNTVATSGVSPNIQVSSGRTYKWYAISTMENTTPPDITWYGVIDGNALVNKDVVYSQGIVSTQVGQNNMNIILQRKTAHINVELDTRGLFGTINNTTSLSLSMKDLTSSGSSSSNLIQTGDLNIKTGQYFNVRDVTSTTGNIANKAGSGGALGATKVFTFHTVNPQSYGAGVLSLKLNNLDITIGNNSIRSFKNITLNYQAQLGPKILLGNQYRIKARMIETGVISKKGRDLKWARSDLRYNPSGADKYVFVSIGNTQNNMTNDADNDYWNWMAATPKGSSTDNIDPCSRVYPEGVWRMPTSSEYSDLVTDVNAGNFGWDTYYSGANLYGADFPIYSNPNTENPANSSFPVSAQKLTFPYGGYRDNSTGKLSNFYTFLFGIIYRQGYLYYWSSTPTNANQAKGFYAYYSTILIVPSYGASIENGSKANDGYRIRCVRN